MKIEPRSGDILNCCISTYFGATHLLDLGGKFSSTKISPRWG